MKVFRSVGWRPDFLHRPAQGVAGLTGSPGPAKFVDCNRPLSWSFACQNLQGSHWPFSVKISMCSVIRAGGPSAKASPKLCACSASGSNIPELLAVPLKRAHFRLLDFGLTVTKLNSAKIQWGMHG
jgi:hypothetical protein